MNIANHSLVSIGYTPLGLNVKPLELTYNQEQVWLLRGVGFSNAIAELTRNEALELIALNNPSSEDL